MPRSVAQDVDREIAFHLEMRTRELVASGWRPREAESEARRQFGDVKATAARCRALEQRRRTAERRSDVFDALRIDLRYAMRQMVRNPGFTASALLTLTLGIGALSAMVTLVDNILLRPLPYPEAHRVMQVWERAEEGHAMRLARPNYEDLRERWRGHEQIALYDGWVGSTAVVGGARPAQAQSVGVSSGFFDVLATAPLRGRTFDGDEARIGGRRAVVVSERFWRRQLGSRDALEGLSLRFFGDTWPVVGVMPEVFDFPPGTDLWYPAEVYEDTSTRTSHNWAAIARLRADVSLERAREEADAVFAQLRSEVPTDEIDAFGAVLVPIHDQMVGGTGRALWFLFGAATLVLLLAATNLSSGLLARAMERRAEMSVRGALGAGGARLVRQLITESTLLTVVGGLLGAAFAFGSLRLLKSLAGERIPRLEETAVDLRVLLITLGVALVTGALFGLVPAAYAARVDIRSVLTDARAGNRGHGRIWNLLVGGEVALALILVVGALLMVYELASLLQRSPGFETSQVLALTVEAQDLSTPDDADIDSYLAVEPEIAAFQARFQQQLRSRPGVGTTGIISHLPLSGRDANGRLCIGGQPCDDDESRQAYAGYRLASDGYFEALGIPVLQGRAFAPSDDAEAPFVAVVNRAFAERYLGRREAVGQTLLSGGMDLHGEQPTEIVGVVGNVLHYGLDQQVRPEVFYPARQRPLRTRTTTHVVRSAIAPDALRTELEGWLRSAYPELPPEIVSLREVRLESVRDRRFSLLVLGGMATLALGLALTGVWAITSYRVAQRHHEFGVRIALGLEPGGVMRLVGRDVLRLLLVGGAVGGALAWAASRLLAGRVAGLQTEPVVFLAALLVLLVTGLLAAWWPARRATTIDPLRVLGGD